MQVGFGVGCVVLCISSRIHYGWTHCVVSPKRVFGVKPELAFAANQAKSALLTPGRRVGPLEYIQITPALEVSNPAESNLPAQRLPQV